MVKVTTDDADFSFTTVLPQPESLMLQGFSPSVVVWYFLFLFSKKRRKENIIIYIRTHRKYHTVFHNRGIAHRQCDYDQRNPGGLLRPSRLCGSAAFLLKRKREMRCSIIILFMEPPRVIMLSAVLFLPTCSSISRGINFAVRALYGESEELL